MEWVRNCKGRFNSMIVRLKDFVALLDTLSNVRFQFYDSPIKSVQAVDVFMAFSKVSIL